SSTTATAATSLPAHVYAPYFETWTTDTISGVAQQSGVRYFTLAFLETTGKSSCTLGWNGSRTQPISSGRYQSDIAMLRGLGGIAGPSAADQLHAADDPGRPRADRPRDPPQRDLERRACRRRQHHDLRLLRPCDDGHGWRGHQRGAGAQ